MDIEQFNNQTVQITNKELHDSKNLVMRYMAETGLLRQFLQSFPFREGIPDDVRHRAAELLELTAEKD